MLEPRWTPWRLALAAVPVSLLAAVLPGQVSANGSTPPARSHTAPALLRSVSPARAHGLVAPGGRHRLVGLRTGLIPKHPGGQQVRFDLFGGDSVVGTFESKTRGPRFTVWSGRLSTPEGYFQVARSGSRYLITLSSLRGSYQITRAAGGAYWVTEPQALRSHRDDAVVPPRAGQTSRVSAGSSSTAATAPAGDVGGDAGTVDVLFVYTAAAAAELGGVSGINAYVGTIQAQSNQAYANSGIPLTMRAVAIVPTTTVEAGGDLSTDLVRVRTPGDGFYDEVPGERDAYHADLVHLLISGDPNAAGICGLAYMGELDQDTTAYGYGTSYVSQSSCAPNHTVTHEVGHNLGADHDEYVNPGTQPGEAPYAHGFVNVSTGALSIMSYPSQVLAQNPSKCCSYPLLFSDPRIPYQAVTFGDPATADNARAITEYSPTAVDYRQSQIYPGSVTITGSPRVGRTVSAVTAGWVPAGVTYTYQWTLDGAPIAGATAQTLKLPASYRGHQLAVVVAGSTASYPAAGAGSAPTVVLYGVFRHLKPRLKGTDRVGHKLTIAFPHARPKPQSVKVKWFRNGHRFKHHGRTYRLTRKDVGASIYARVVVKQRGYVTAHAKTGKVKIRR
jgi:hypothetical protein